MSHHKLRIYRFQPYNPSDSYSQESLPSITHISTSQSTLQTGSYNTNLPHNSDPNTISTSVMQFSQQIQNSSNLNTNSFPPWRPSQRLRSLHTHFQNTILCQHNQNCTYPLEVNFQNINV